MHSVQVLRHALQVLYSRSKGCVDCAEQFRSELNCRGDCLGCESKAVLYYFKTLLVNEFLACRLMECNDHLRSSEHFVSLASFRDNLNRTMAFSDFAAEVSERLLAYAKVLSNEAMYNGIRNEDEGRDDNKTVLVPK